MHISKNSSPHKPNVTMNKHRGSTHTDDKTDSSDGDGNDLICGFGRRRRHTEESGDKIFSDRSGDNTLICGFGGDGGSCSSAGDSMQEALQEGMAHWVFEGGDNMVPGLREGSTGSESQLNPPMNGDGLLSDLLTNLEEAEVDDSMKETSEQEQTAEVSVYSVSTKVDDGSGVRRVPRRRSNRSLDESGNSSTFDDMSMASEDAIVLMLDLLNESDNEDRGKEHKRRPHTEICGRIYRHVPNVDYDHLPMELEIGGDTPRHGKPHSNNNDISPLPTSIQITDSTNRREESPGPPKNISVEHQFHVSESTSTTPQSFYNVTSKQKSNTEPQQESPAQTSNAQPHSLQDTPPPQDSTVATFFPRPKKIEVYSDGTLDDTLEGVIVEEDKYGKLTNKLELAQRRRSADLDIIEEGSGDSQSESMGLKSSFASKTTESDYAFLEDEDEFDANIDPEIDMLQAITSSRKKSLTGEHAKSMAKEFKREPPVRTREFCIISAPCYFL